MKDTSLTVLTRRNVKLFFRDKGMFFTALITPAILLVLYATFLADVYRDSFVAGLPQNISINEKLIDALVGGQLVSSILAVSCVTVAFCSNFLMVNDKVTGTLRDLTVSPVRRSTLAFSYYIASVVSTLTVCLAAMCICLVYIAAVAWYISVSDVLLLLLDVVLLVLFGTALSSIINFFLTSQGQISAVGTIVSSGYGFICGAYMPISSFGEGLQTVISFLPGTYGTSLVRNHAMRGALDKMAEEIPADAMDSLRDVLDCNLYFFDIRIDQPMMYLILALSVVTLVGVYVLMNANILRKKRVEK